MVTLEGKNNRGAQSELGNAILNQEGFIEKVVFCLRLKER